jgi:hypothetical protein
MASLAKNPATAQCQRDASVYNGLRVDLHTARALDLRCLTWTERKCHMTLLPVLTEQSSEPVGEMVCLFGWLGPCSTSWEFLVQLLEWTQGQRQRGGLSSSISFKIFSYKWSFSNV